MTIGAFARVNTANADVIYDPATAFEAGYNSASNPNGVWSYGYSSTVGGPLTLYTAQTPGADSPNQQFWISPSVNCCTASPAVGYNNGPAFNDGNVAQAANQIDMVASDGQNLVDDLVFKAPTSGTYGLTSSFIGDQNGIGVNVFVLVNGTTVFSSAVTSFGEVVAFDSSFLLSAGDTVEFAVQQGGGLQNTGLDASLTLPTTTVPEPASLALLLSALTVLAFYRPRRTF